MNNNNKKQIDVFVVLGAISSLISIGTFVKKIIDNHTVVFSWSYIIALVIAILFFLIFAIKRNTTFRYELKKFFVYYFTHTDESLFIERKESIYIFKDRTHMEHIKNHVIRSKVSQLCNYSDKFKWSKPQSKAEEDKMLKNLSANGTGCNISTKRNENWIEYTLNFTGIGKGETKELGITLKNLEDSNMESLLFLSGNVIYKTKEFLLKVVIEDVSLFPTNIEYKIYNNYASSFPVFTKKLDFKNEGTKKCIEYIESKPIPGYRYVISWEF